MPRCFTTALWEATILGKLFPFDLGYQVPFAAGVKTQTGMMIGAFGLIDRP